MARVPVSDKSKRDSSDAKSLQSIKMEDFLTAYAFLAPAILIFTVFLIIPIFFALFVSITDWNGISPLYQSAHGATGFIEFTNLGTAEVTIPAGTVVNSIGDTPIGYETTEEALVPAGTGSLVSVPVQAVDASLGSDSNIRARVVTEIQDEAVSALVTANNPLPIAGGVDNAYEIVGLDNYRKLLFETGIPQRDFFLSLKNTLYFVLGVVPVQTILALCLAVILNQGWLRFRSAFRTAFYFPSVTSSVVISIIFMWMFTRSGIINTALQWIIPNYQAITWLDDASGLIHNFLGWFGLNRDTMGEWWQQRFAGLTFWDWISGPSVTMSTIMILNTWTTVGTLMVIYLAALQNIPSQVYEAAQIDGATAWQTFTRITVPLLAPTTFFVVTLGLIGTFQVFDQIFVISSGGPAKTTLTIAYIVYENGFKNSQMGLAAATALILFVIIFIFTMIQRFFTTDRVDY
jgi:multiple sugar transport system permease protein